jgi:ABC-type multidrug transport system fused ATPase/permease subunit
MKAGLPQLRLKFFRAPFLTPKDLVLRAAVFCALFLLAHVAGLRESTSFLSGTVPSPDTSWQHAAFLGSVYILLYFAFVLLVPILLLAAIFSAVWRRVSSVRRRIVKRDAPDVRENQVRAAESRHLS